MREFPQLSSALQPGRRSARLYVRLEPSLTRLFRYLLEAEDNLAYTSVVDRKICILKVVFAPEQRKQLLHSLENMQQTLKFELLEPAAFSQAVQFEQTDPLGRFKESAPLGWAAPADFSY